MSGFLLDTGAAITLRDAVTAADQRLEELGDVPRLSVVSRVELEGGVVAIHALAARRRLLLDEMLLAFPVLDFDTACVEAYRWIVERVGFSRPRIVDRMIAATGLAHRLTVVTTNPRDFRDVPGLVFEVWPSA